MPPALPLSSVHARTYTHTHIHTTVATVAMLNCPLFGTYFFFPAPLGLQNLNSLIRYWTQAPAMKTPNPNHWTTREFLFGFWSSLKLVTLLNCFHFLERTMDKPWLCMWYVHRRLFFLSILTIHPIGLSLKIFLKAFPSPYLSKCTCVLTHHHLFVIVWLFTIWDCLLIYIPLLLHELYEYRSPGSRDKRGQCLVLEGI